MWRTQVQRWNRGGHRRRQQNGAFLLQACWSINATRANAQAPNPLGLPCQRQHTGATKAPLSPRRDVQTSRARFHLYGSSCPESIPRWLSTAAIPILSRVEPGLPNNKPIRCYQELDGLDGFLRNRLLEMNMTKMTDIQAQTWWPAVSGIDVIGLAPTGTGKTLAFLVPAIERILRKRLTIYDDGEQPEQQERPSQAQTGGVKLLILSPTRELTLQIYAQSVRLTHPSQATVSAPLLACQALVGGISRNLDLIRMEQSMPSVLVATPGRFLDHWENSSATIGGRPFRDHFGNLQTLVLDEMARLLDMGFRDKIGKIVSHFPRASSTAATSAEAETATATSITQRQTLCFSATFPDDVRRTIQQLCRPNQLVMVDCTQDEFRNDDHDSICDNRYSNDGDSSEHSNHPTTLIHQSHVVLPSDRMISGVVQILFHLMDTTPNYKIMVFFPTTSQVAYFAKLFQAYFGRHALELHSKKNQIVRTYTSDRFHSLDRAVLFTSDVSARGVDYPNVTHVLQVGAANNRDTYIHRLGRTGRAGKQGRGILLLMDAERKFLTHDLKSFNIPMDTRLQRMVQESLPEDVEEQFMHAQHMVRNAALPSSSSNQHGNLEVDARETYLSLLGYYNSRLPALGVTSKDVLVDLVNQFAEQSGLRHVPHLPLRMAEQFRLVGHRGIDTRIPWTTGSNFDVGRRRGLVRNSLSGSLARKMNGMDKKEKAS